MLKKVHAFNPENKKKGWGNFGKHKVDLFRGKISDVCNNKNCSVIWVIQSHFVTLGKVFYPAAVQNYLCTSVVGVKFRNNVLSLRSRSSKHEQFYIVPRLAVISKLPKKHHERGCQVKLYDMTLRFSKNMGVLLRDSSRSLP